MTLPMLTDAELLAQPDDAYMNDAQQAFFRGLLLRERHELQLRIAEEFAVLRERETSSDPADIGSAEEQRQWQLRLLEREKKLLDKIDEALDRLARGEYGWCLGSVPVSARAALPRQMPPGKAQDAGNGRSLAKSCNTAWRHLPRNPAGRAGFCALLRFSSLIWNTKPRSSCLAARKNRLRRGRDETGTDPLTGEAIGLKRLLLRPTASLCIEAKERQEQREKHLHHAEH